MASHSLKAWYFLVVTVHRCPAEIYHLNANTECHELTAFAPLMSPIQIPFGACNRSCILGFRRSKIDGNSYCCYDCDPCPDGQITNETGIYKMVLNLEISRNGSECEIDAP